jgi:hypothetical protein
LFRRDSAVLGRGTFYCKLWDVQRIEVCSQTPFQFTADVSHEHRKNENMTQQIVFSDAVTAYILEIATNKRNCYRSGSATNIVDNVHSAVWGAAETCLIVRTVFFFRTVGVAGMLRRAPR